MSPTAARRRRGDSTSKKGATDGSSPKSHSRKLREMANVGAIGLQMKPMLDSGSDMDLRKAATAPENSAEEDLKGELLDHQLNGNINGDDAEMKEPKGSDEDSDVESMLREMDPVKRHIKQLKLKKKQME